MKIELMSKIIMWVSIILMGLFTIGMIWLGVTLSQRISESGLRGVIEEVWNGEEAED